MRSSKKRAPTITIKQRFPCPLFIFHLIVAQNIRERPLFLLYHIVSHPSTPSAEFQDSLRIFQGIGKAIRKVKIQLDEPMAWEAFGRWFKSRLWQLLYQEPEPKVGIRGRSRCRGSAPGPALWCCRKQGKVHLSYEQP